MTNWRFNRGHLLTPRFWTPPDSVVVLLELLRDQARRLMSGSGWGTAACRARLGAFELRAVGHGAQGGAEFGASGAEISDLMGEERSAYDRDVRQTARHLSLKRASPKRRTRCLLDR